MSDIAIKWIDALRSGKYTQGFGALRTIDDDGSVCHCVVGVLADVIDPNGWTSHVPGQPELESEEEVEPFPAVYWRGKLFGIPDSELESAEIPWAAQNKAMGLNDDEMMSFEALADYLEEELSTGSIG